LYRERGGAYPLRLVTPAGDYSVCMCSRCRAKCWESAHVLRGAPAERLVRRLRPKLMLNGRAAA
jgi:hypothetical protein